VAGKLLELAIAIKGKLDQAYTESMRRAISEAGNLQRQLGDINRAAQGSHKLLQQLGDLKGMESTILKFRELRQSVTNYAIQLNQTQASVRKYSEEFKRSQAQTEQLRQRHEALASSLKNLKGKIPIAEWRQMKEEAKNVKAALKESEANTKAAGRAFEQAKNQAASLRNKLAEQRAELQQIKANMESAGYSAQHLSQSESRLRQEIQQTTRALEQANRVQAQVDARRAALETNHKAQTDAYNAYSNFQNAIGTAQTIVSPFAGAIENAMTFEHAMSRVKALTQSGLIRQGDFDAVNANMQKLEAQARELGATTQFTMTQAADAMGYLGMAGWKTEQIYGTMPGMLDLAAGAGTDLARTADIVSDNMTAMGIPVEKAGHFMDVYAYALTNANVNLESLGETMKYAAPVAAAFGATLEDTAAMTMMMGNAGIKGSMAGTALRMGLLRLSGPPKKATKEMEALGISVSDATAMALESQAALKGLGVEFDENAPPMEKMGNIIKQLQVKMKGLSREEKLASIGAIFGANAASGWVNIIEQGGDVFDNYRNALRNSDGYAKQFAKTMNDDTRGAMIALDSATDAVVNALGTVFLPVVRQAAEALAPMATEMAKWLSENKEVAFALGILAAALAAVIVTAAGVQLVFAGWGLINSTITLVTTSTTLLAIKTKLSAAATFLHAAANTALAASMNALRNPITTVTGLFAGMPAKLTAARSAIMGLPAMISGAFTALPGVISGAFASLAAVGWPVVLAILAIVAVVALVAANFDKLKETATIVFNHISGTVSAWVATIQAKFAEALNKITEVWNSIAGQSLQSSELIGAIFNNLGFVLGAAFDIAAGIIGTAISVIINWVASMAQIIGGVINIVAGILTGDWDRAWKGAGQAVEGFAGGTLGTIKTIAGGIGDIFDTLMGKSDEVQKKAEQAKATAELSKAGASSAEIADNAAALANAQQTAAATQQAADAAAAANQNTQAMAEGMGATGQNAQQAATYTQQLQNVMAQVPAQSQAAFSGMGEQSATAAQAINTNLQQIPAQAQTTLQQLPPITQQNTDAMAQEFNQLAVKCQPGADAFIQAANNWGEQAYQNIANWADQMAQVVVDRLTNAWTQISSQFSAGLNVHVTTSGGNVAHNAMGGIYNKGAFLTTFAEKSPEAAIPLDGSNRAVSLWQRAGEMLGMMPKGVSGKKSFDVPKMSFISYPPIESGLTMPPFMNMVDALPPEISAIAEIASPPTEAEMAAAPIAYEPPSAGGEISVNFNPQITIQGNANEETVSQMEGMLSKLKSELLRELRREYPNIAADYQHNQRRRSFAT